MAHTWTHVDTLPECDICKHFAIPGRTTISPARVDGKTKHGKWVAMCIGHYHNFGIGLGIGKGQYLLLPGESVPPWVPKR